METAPGTEAGGKSARGRKDGDGQEAVIKLKPLKESFKELATLYTKAEDSKDKFNDAVKKVAERSGLMSSVVSKLVKAKSGEKFEDVKRTADQMSIVFAEFSDTPTQ